jgi:predicted metal-dependent phosphotriesterase family hydrolase
MLYIHRHVLPELTAMGIGDDVVQTMFVDNPRRFLAGE